MSSIYDISTYVPSPGEDFFFDNNVWMYLYCPIGNYKQHVVSHYSGFLKKIIMARSNIYISSLILSEFFNSYIRLEYNVLQDGDPSKYRNFKKDFRGSKEYEKAMSFIKTTVNSQILKLSRRINDSFDGIDMTDLMNRIETYDYNDKYIMKLSGMNGFKVVTNDIDYASCMHGVAIITANRKLISLSS